MSKNWFEVDKEGFKALQLGKPKYYAIRELIQNALDEDITKCIIETSYTRGKVTISVEDDGIGFRNIADAYTLFGATYKQDNPELRGRFNVGEKQAFAICKNATIETTTGTVVFDSKGRRTTKSKRDKGTKVTIVLTITKKEYEEMLAFTRLIIPPDDIELNLDKEIIPTPSCIGRFVTSLRTERLDKESGQFKPTVRNTIVRLYNSQNQSYLYEMGIPVCEIECEYSIDVDQRVPLGFDRDKVPQYYMQDLFAEVLNNTHSNIPKESISETWVRTAMCDDRVTGDAVKTVVDKRFGDKNIVASPKDPLSVDDAISSGYNVVHGAEMSKEEWDNIRKHEVMKSTTQVFGHNSVSAKTITPDENMKKLSRLAKKIAKKVLGFNITVRFIKSKLVTSQATYGNRMLTFNMSKITNLNTPLCEENLELIIHELAHEYGHHTQKDYQDAICELGGSLTMIALNDRKFFKEFRMEVV